jgi:hypothetical protein
MIAGDKKTPPSPTVEAMTLVLVLQPFLGPHTARNAVRTFSKKALGRSADRFERAEAELVLAAMHPMLRTLLGKAAENLMGVLRQALP